MAYIRLHGSQLELVHGMRHPETKKVEQQVLFTFYSKHEALGAIGEGESGADHAFRSQCESEHPTIRFDWPTINKSLRDKLHALPDREDADRQRSETKFQATLFDFTRQLILTDPAYDMDAQTLLRRHSWMLQVLADLIERRISDDLVRAYTLPTMPRGGKLQRTSVPQQIEDFAEGYREQGHMEKAEAAFSLLVGAFDNYAEGHNYLGLIALDQGKVEEAIVHFRRTIEVGRRLFSKHLAKKSYWTNHDTRPYMRGLRNLTLCLNRVRQFDEALAICDRLDEECGDTLTADYFRTMILLNTNRSQEAFSKARTLTDFYPDTSFMAAFALFTLGRKDEATGYFLHATLNFPRTAQMIFGTKRLSKPKLYQEIEDHNAGVAMLTNLDPYLKRPTVSARRFFSTLLDSSNVRVLVEELQVAERNWQLSRGGEDRADFDKISDMQSFEFAVARAKALQAIPTL